MTLKALSYVLACSAIMAALVAVSQLSSQLPGTIPIQLQFVGSRERLLRSSLMPSPLAPTTPIYVQKNVAYGILLDAGSGSTKPGIWSWNPCYDEVPGITLIAELSRLPALSSFATSEGGNESDAGPMLAPAIEEAKKVIPEDMWKHTPVYLAATAGMRLVPEWDRARILRSVNSWLADPNTHPFLFGTRSLVDGQFWAQTIAGEDEGAFGFLDLNFMLGKLEGQDEEVVNEDNSNDVAYVAGKREKAATGWIDTGGASLQLAFAPRQSSILGNVYPVHPLEFTHVTNSTGSVYAADVIYTHSWNGLGQREARKRLQAGMVNFALKDRPKMFSLGNILSDPCLLKGQNQTILAELPSGNRNVTFVGGGDFFMCEIMIDEHVLDLEPCLMDPCGAAGVYIPESTGVTFMGFRKMLKLAQPMGLIQKKEAWAPNSYDNIEKLVHEVCSLSAEEAKAIDIKDEYETDSGPCFQGVLMLRFLQTMGSPQIVFADRIKGVKFTFARGAMLSYIMNQDRASALKRPKDWPYCKPQYVWPYQ